MPTCASDYDGKVYIQRQVPTRREGWPLCHQTKSAPGDGAWSTDEALDPTYVVVQISKRCLVTYDSFLSSYWFPYSRSTWAEGFNSTRSWIGWREGGVEQKHQHCQIASVISVPDLTFQCYSVNLMSTFKYNVTHCICTIQYIQNLLIVEKF